jgi:hypothetical protein
MPRTKDASGARRQKEDKAILFWEAWRLYADCPVMPTPEHKFARSIEYRNAAGRLAKRNYQADYCFVDARVLVEVDGGQYAPGGGRHATDKDREKQNCAALLGYVVFHFSPAMLKRDPLHCVEQVRMAVMGR